MLNKTTSKIIFLSALLVCSHTPLHAQETQRAKPQWWIGGAAAANSNFYGGTTQVLNPALTAPAPFHEGFGTGLYLAPLIEYHFDDTWAGMLQLGYDDRSGTFDDQICPCGEIETLSAKVRYLSIEPSVRYAPFSGNLSIFAGPRVAFNWVPNIPQSSVRNDGSFLYTRQGQPDTKADFSNMRSVVYSGQIGMGYDIPLAAPNNRNQVELSPFISFQPFIGEGPRSTESWRVSTLRVGMELKFGRGTILPWHAPLTIPSPCDDSDRDVQFSVRAPRVVIAKRRIRETFPLRNYVFFDKGSSSIPGRYVMLTKEQAANFKEEQLQDVQPKSTGRSLRQMNVYYNILNTLGDRMRRNPATTIVLNGASEKGPDHGKARAEAIKQYLVDVFGIDGARITTEGLEKPRTPSEQPGGTKDIDLLQAEDRRVDIESNSPEILTPVAGSANSLMKPVQIIALVEDPLGSPVVFDAVGAQKNFTSWSLEITDERDSVQRFGPFAQDRESIPGNTLLNGRAKGDYNAVMIGRTKDGKTIRKEGSFSLIHKVEPIRETVRFSILFDFDKSKTVANYEKFLTNIVTPLIPDSATIVIHGHTDIIGEPGYNDTLSQKRAQDTHDILEHALSGNPKREIDFETVGFGANPQQAPFDNDLPEERFYNRTVTIDIVPD